MAKRHAEFGLHHPLAASAAAGVSPPSTRLVRPSAVLP
jgi:hypothetical protein